MTSRAVAVGVAIAAAATATSDKPMPDHLAAMYALLNVLCLVARHDHVSTAQACWYTMPCQTGSTRSPVCTRKR